MIQALIDRMKVLNGQMVCLYIKHILYGSQKIKCALRLLWDGERIGFKINDEDIYITMDELCEVSIDDAKCILKSDVMELRILF